MNWDAIGAIGEITGAVAVVVTLIILILQIRQSTKATLESNKLERAIAIDRHSESVARWRGRITDSEDLSSIWLKASTNQKLSEIELLRVNNLWIEFTNTQRSNFVRSETVGEQGLAEQAVIAVAVESIKGPLFQDLWTSIVPWIKLSSPKFVDFVEAKRRELQRENNTVYEIVPTLRDSDSG